MSALRLSAYLPKSRVAELLAEPPASLFGREERSFAVVSFCDISGFTPLSEALAAIGREGAELLTAILNDLFGELIGRIESSGGDVARFGGDAMTVLHRPLPNEPAGETALRAAAAAASLQRAIAERGEIRTRAGEFRLTMKIGIASGEVFSTVVGLPEGPWEDVIAGRAVDGAAESEHRASAGEIVLDSATAAFLAGGARLTPAGPEHFRLCELLTEPGARPGSESAGPLPGDFAERIRPFLPADLHAQIVGGNDPVGEIRNAAVVFLRFSGIDFDEDPGAGAKLGELVAAVVGTLAVHGGTLGRVDMGDKGSKLILLFGAPTACENREERAVRAATEILRRSGGLSFPLRMRIGINAGPLFAGAVGGSGRREYTVMGDVVNVAARLMGAADDDTILVGAPIAERAGRRLRFEALPPIRVKGKGEPIPIFTPAGEAERRPTVAVSLPAEARLVGRDAECRLFESWLAAARRSEGRLVSLHGEAGLGKSRLTEAWQRAAADSGFRVVVGAAEAHGSGVAYGPWRSVVAMLLGLDDRRPERPVPHDLRAAVSARIPDRPGGGRGDVRFGELFGLPPAEEGPARELDPRTRKERLFARVLELFALPVRAPDGSTPPALVVLEDLHWADSLSRDLLEYIGRNLARLPIVLVATHRPELRFEDWGALDHAVSLPLPPLGDDAIAELARARLGVAVLPAELEPFLASKAQGNPFFLEELLRALRERGLLEVVDGRARLAGELEVAGIPDTVEGILLSRIDALHHAPRRVLKIAACIGRTFSSGLLSAVHPEQLAESEFPPLFATLERSGLTVPDGSAAWAFRHALVRDVAYDSLLFAERRRIHGRIGAELEARSDEERESSLALLAFHFDRAGDAGRAIAYWERAGADSKGRYANEEAIRAFSRCLELVAEAGDPESEREIRVRLARGEVTKLLVRFDEALDDFGRAAELARDRGDRGRAVAALAAASVILETRQDFEGALLRASRIRELLAERPERGIEEQALFLEGVVAFRRGDYETAERLLSSILETEPTDSDWRVHADALRMLALVEVGRNGAERAFARIAELRGLLERWPDGAARLRTLVLEANTDIHFRRFEEAGRALEEAIALCRAQGDRTNLATLECLSGELSVSQGDLEAARLGFERSLEIFRELGNAAGEGTALLGLGGTKFLSGDHRRSVDIYHEALGIFERIHDLRHCALLSYNLAEAYREIGDRQQCARHARSAAELWSRLGSESEAAEALLFVDEAERAIAGEAGARKIPGDM